MSPSSKCLSTIQPYFKSRAAILLSQYFKCLKYRPEQCMKFELLSSKQFSILAKYNLQLRSIRLYNKICPRMFVWSIPYTLTQLLYVIVRNPFRISQDSSHQNRNSHLKCQLMMTWKIDLRVNIKNIDQTWTTTSVILKFGSGDMTVLPVYSVRFPDKLPRNRPVFPLSRWTRPRCCDSGREGASLLIYSTTWSWRNCQQSFKQRR